MMIPSFDEVVAAIKRAPAPHTYTPRQIRLLVDHTPDRLPRASNMSFDPDVKIQAVLLEKFHYYDEDGRSFETWKVVSMPEFHL